MRRLLILRHAKAAREGAVPGDFERPLTDRGHADTAAMGREIARLGLWPDRILCSSARRTRETLAGLLPSFPQDCEAMLVRDLYEPDTGSYLPLAARHGGEAGTLMLIGHNPHVHEAARALARLGDEARLQALRERFPTGCLAVIDFDAPHWRRLGALPGHLTALIRPDELPPSG